MSISEDQKKEYQKYVKEITPTHSLPLEMGKAFLTGGIICLLGQLLQNAGMALGLEQEAAGTMHDFLMKLRDTKLQNDDVLRIFYEKVAEFYPEVENVAIILIYNVYDIPGRGDDNFKNMEASDEVYEYISCNLCPVKLEEPGLVYTGEKFEHKDRRWQIGMPVHGFIFPSFEDRSSDIHNITVFNKKSDGAFDDFDQEILGLRPVASADMQKQSFKAAL